MQPFNSELLRLKNVTEQNRFSRNRNDYARL